MGLDMYLARKVYVGTQYGYRKVNASVRISVGGVPPNINRDIRVKKHRRIYVLKLTLKSMLEKS